MEGLEHCGIGRYDRCEERAREALKLAPEMALAHSLLACAQSFQGRDADAMAAGQRAMELIDGVVSRRDRLVIQQDGAFIQASLALQRGDTTAAAERGREVVRMDLELAEVYRDPIGYLYAGIAHHWLLSDVVKAREMYALARRLTPGVYPPYHEEAKVLKDALATRDDAARILWTYIECNPRSPLNDVARADAASWSLARPSDLPPCE
jgi:hypothetical protein